MSPRRTWDNQLASQWAPSMEAEQQRIERARQGLAAYINDRRARGIPTDGLRRRNLEPHTIPTRRRTA